VRDILLEAVALKEVIRAGWVRAGVPRPESVADHSWGVAWLVLALLPEELDRERALLYAVLHDLPEVRTGDLTPRDGVSRAAKHAREREGMAALCAALPSPRGAALLRVWEDYEAQADPESRFVRQLDRLDMAIQAVRYGARDGLDLGEFVESAGAAITDPGLRRVLDALTREATRTGDRP
jgi:5'-deoxynucleotidase YfbR-like HD superfamily hydrolase